MIKTFLGPRGAAKRRHNRAAANVPCSLEFTEQGGIVDALILDVSLGGALIRPMSRYLVNRTDQPIEIIVRGLTRTGRIRSSSPFGYGAAFDDPLTDLELAALIAQRFGRTAA